MYRDSNMKVLKLNLHWQINLTKVILLLLFGVLNSSLKGQQAIPATGGNATGSGGSVSFSVGQVVYTTKQSSGGIISEGVQQSYEISVISGVGDEKTITLFCSVYPNPVVSDLTLRVDENIIHPLAYQLYTIDGKFIQYAAIVSSETTIAMGSLSTGLYLLRIVETKSTVAPSSSSLRVVKIFKIVKN